MKRFFGEVWHELRRSIPRTIYFIRNGQIHPEVAPTYYMDHTLVELEHVDRPRKYRVTTPNGFSWVHHATRNATTLCIPRGSTIEEVSA